MGDFACAANDIKHKDTYHDLYTIGWHVRLCIALCDSARRVQPVVLPEQEIRELSVNFLPARNKRRGISGWPSEVVNDVSFYERCSGVFRSSAPSLAGHKASSLSPFLDKKLELCSAKA